MSTQKRWLIIYGLLFLLVIGGIIAYSRISYSSLHRGAQRNITQWVQQHTELVEALNGRGQQRATDVYTQLNTKSQWVAARHLSHDVVAFTVFGFGKTLSYEGFAWVPWDGPISIWYEESDEAQSALFIREGDGWVWRDASQQEPHTHYSRRIADHIWYCATD